MTPAVDVRDASVALAGRSVLSGVSLHLGVGEVISLLGANGSGKSTLVRAVVGLVPLQAGRVELFGTALPRFRQWRRIGYVPQRVTAASGVPATVAEVVASGRLSHRPWGRLRAADRHAVGAALGVVGMTELAGAGVARLSGGQQQRVLIARALAAEPDLLILDEPLSGLDDSAQRAVVNTLRTLVAAGTSALVVLHETGPFASLVDRCVVLHGGRAVPAVGVHHATADHPHEAAAPPHESVTVPTTSFGLATSPLDPDA